MAIKNQILISETDVKLIELISTIYNVALLAFYRAIDQSKTIFNLVNSFMDEYEDESGVDTVGSANQEYNSTDDYYSPILSGWDSYTKLILHLDNNVTDEIGKTVTNTDVTFSSSVKKFGTHSALFNSSSSYLSLADSDDFNFGNGDFTIDTWVYRIADGRGALLDHYQDNNNRMHMAFFGDPGSGPVGIYLYIILGGSSILYMDVADTGITVGAWHHVALVRNGNLWSIYVDGVSIVSTTSSITYPNYSGNFNIGVYTYDGVPAANRFFNGYMDEYRISKGIARWTSDFTPPISAYTQTVNNMMLLSNAQTAESVPTSSRIVIFEEDVDSITLNTDIKAYVSRDDGTTFTQVTLADEGYYATSKNILVGLVDISSQPSGTNMIYKIEVLNNKILKIHGTGLNWA